MYDSCTPNSSPVAETEMDLAADLHDGYLHDEGHLHDVHVPQPRRVSSIGLPGEDEPNSPPAHAVFGAPGESTV